MKKTILTLACVAFIGFVSNAQSDSRAPKTDQKQTVNPDGTAVPDKASDAPKPAEGVQVESAQTAPAGTRPTQAPAVTTPPAQPKKDRHAITEKGVPASKSKPATDPKAVEKKKTTPPAGNQ